MTLCGRCQQVVRKEHPMIRVSGEEPTVDHHNAFRSLKQSAKSCELCKTILESAAHDHGLSLDDEADMERAFQGLKLRVEVNHYLCNPYQSNPPSSNDITAWGLRAYWIREEMSTNLILRKEMNDTRERPIWTSSRPAAVEALLPTILTWLKECDDTHTSECSLQGAPNIAILPTRCIDVGEADGSVQPRLAISGGSHGRYTTLSHCWGKDQLPVKLTTSSVLPMSDTIDLDTLPKTYRDAISITRALGIRYIWIDSLCIIQDDADDWERESANMASIYRNAYLNIAATSALDSDGGCLHTPRPTSSFQIQPPPRWSGMGRFGAGPRLGETAPPEQPTLALVRPSGSAAKLEKAALNTRAWVLQEVCLSRRTIHFAEDQMYWFCAERQASEDGTHVHTQHFGAPQRVPLLGPPHWLMGQHEDLIRGSVYTMWWTLVEDYSSRALTHASDKMAALAGLTQFFQERLKGDEPVAGMWKAELVDSLCWTYDSLRGGGEGRGSSISGSGPPSWSWMSIDGPIKRNCCRLSNELSSTRTEKGLAIESVDINWSGRPLTSSMQGGRLVGRGLLVELDFRREEEHAHQCAAAGRGNPDQMILFQGESRVVGRFKFDQRSLMSSGTVQCLAVTQKQVTLNFCPPQEPVYFWFHVMILQATRREDGEFHRIGVGKVWANSGVFDEVQPQVVKIV